MSGDRQTESGILLPDVGEDRGNPIVTLLLDFQGGQLNILGPNDQDVEDWGQTIAEMQRRLAAGDYPPCAVAREPMFGEQLFITPEAARHCVGVVRGFMKVIDPTAARNAPKIVRAQVPPALPPRGR
jgi:hypothetical protein